MRIKEKLKQLFCKHEYELDEEQPTYWQRVFVCKKCGKKKFVSQLEEMQYTCSPTITVRIRKEDLKGGKDDK